jgi:hypothetical protein
MASPSSHPIDRLEIAVTAIAHDVRDIKDAVDNMQNRLDKISENINILVVDLHTRLDVLKCDILAVLAKVYESPKMK